MSFEFDNLEQLIDESMRNIFIKKIFAGNSDEYLQFISSLDIIDEWKEAYQFINDEFSQRNIDINRDRAAISFTDIVFKKYFPLYHF
ncbi:hypothetical protein L0128_14685 [candidate division KSB1 bacterium]|nr:hypothetical protein [candidate division KSB1 bacterium]